MSVGAPFQPHSETSRLAAEEIYKSLPPLQAAVLYGIRQLGGATDEQLQIELRLDPSTQRPRRVELVNKGLVRDSGRTKPTRSGRKAVVWEVV